MKDQNIVRKLIQGSYNIDTMKQEVNEVLCCLMGIMRVGELGSYKTQDEYIRSFTTTEGQYFWEVVAGICHTNHKKNHIKIECRAKTQAPEQQVFSTHNCVRISLDMNIQFAKGAESILEAHEALPILVNGLLERYPFLRQNCNPFFKAAEVNLG